MRRAAVLVVLIAALAFGAVANGDDGPRVVVRDAGGDVVASAALARRRPLRARLPPLGLRSACRGALPRARRRPLRAGEHRLAEPAGARVLRARGPHHATAGSSRPSAARFTTMALAATERGRRTLVVGDDARPALRRARAAPADRGGGDMTERPARDTPETSDHLLDEFEAERPGRDLDGFPAHLVAVLGAGLALFAILWVFRPLAPQVYRPAFLTVALLLTFIVFGRAKRPSASDWVGRRARGRGDRLRRRGQRRAHPPRRPADDAGHRLRHRRDPRRARGHAPHDRLGAAGDLHRLPVLRLLRRADPRRAADRPQGLRPRPHRRPELHGPGGHLRHPARRRRDLHRPVRDLRRRARVLRRRALLRRDLLRRLRPLAHRPGPDAARSPASCSARSPAPAWRPRSRWAASPGRCCARPAIPRTRAAGSWPRAASARSSARRRWAPRRSSSPRSSRSATCRCWSTRSSRRSSTTSGSCWRSRPTRAATRSRAWTSRPRAW